MKGTITMKDIAERFGVSTVTVSKALNDKEGVSEELKLKIKQAAEEMGYRFNTHAKSMKEGLVYNIGIIIPERFTNSAQAFYLQFYQYLSKSLDKHHYSGILHILSHQDEEQLVLPRIYTERKVDGFIMLGQISKEYIGIIQETETPVLFLDFYTDQSSIDSVLTDNFFGTYEMTNYLVSNGHRNIAFIGNIHSTSSIQDRFLGYCKSHLEHHLPIREDYIISDRNEKGKYIPLKLPELEDMPTAFVCNCDQVAFNLMGELKKRGIRIPEDCSIAGFDNDIFASLAEPGLTTVEVNMPEMARMAVKFIIEKIKDNTKSYGRVLVKGNMIFRDSVRNISHKE